jgi:DNA-binding transcriptional LysR family regulator
VDRLEAMSFLVASAEAGSFSAAGRLLGVPLPTISRKIAELETLLNAQLLIRSTRRLSLTEAGTTYISACKRILEQVEEAQSQAAGEFTLPRGTLTMTAPIVFGRLHIVPIVDDFLAKFPQINIQLTLSDTTLNLVDEHIDLAVRIGDLPDSSMVAMKVGEIRRIVCGSPAYFAAHGTPRTPEDLAQHMCVTFTAMAAGMTWVFNPKGGKNTRGVRPLCRLRINTAEAAIDAAIAGVGVTNVLSYQVAKAVAEGKLRLILQDYEPDPSPVHLVQGGQTLVPLKTRRFIEFATPRLRRSLTSELVKLGVQKETPKPKQKQRY